MSKILVVEDDNFAQHFYKMLLTKKGFDVIFAEDPVEIFEIISKDNIELVILDVNLKNSRYNDKDVDGFDLSIMIKEKKSSLPVLLVSAFCLNENTWQKFKQSKAEEYIQKPIVDFNLFLEKINELISRSKNERNV